LKLLFILIDCSPKSTAQLYTMTDLDILQTMKLDLLDMDIILNNVVATFSLGNGVNLDLPALVLRGINIEMKGGKGYAQIKLRNPSATANVYASGKVTVCGAKSEALAKLAARKFARIIQRIVLQQNKICIKAGGHHRICVKNYKIVNVWSSTVLPWDLNITKFAKAYREAQYEPEIHSAVIYQISEPKATLKINSKGSLVVQAPKVPNVSAAVRYIYPLVYPYRKERKVKVVEVESKTRAKDKMWRSNTKI